MVLCIRSGISFPIVVRASCSLRAMRGGGPRRITVAGDIFIRDGCRITSDGAIGILFVGDFRRIIYRKVAIRDHHSMVDEVTGGKLARRYNQITPGPVTPEIVYSPTESSIP